MDSKIIIGRGVTAGTNAYTTTLSVAVKELLNGNRIDVLFTIGNTAASSLNPNGIGVIVLTDNYGEGLTGGEIPEQTTLTLEYVLASNELKIVSNASTGNIARVRGALKTDTQTITTVAPAWSNAAGLTLTMIPSKSSDSFLVQGFANTGCNVNESMMLRIIRIVDPSGVPVESIVGGGDPAGNRSRVTGAPYSGTNTEMDIYGWSFIDNPATADDVLYKVQVTKAGFDASDGFINRGETNLNAASNGRAASGLTIFQLN